MNIKVYYFYKLYNISKFLYLLSVYYYFGYSHVVHNKIHITLTYIDNYLTCRNVTLIIKTHV